MFQRESWKPFILGSKGEKVKGQNQEAQKKQYRPAWDFALLWVPAFTNLVFL